MKVEWVGKRLNKFQFQLKPGSVDVFWVRGWCGGDVVHGEEGIWRKRRCQAQAHVASTPRRRRRSLRVPLHFVQHSPFY